MIGRRLKKWFPVLLVLLFVAGGVALIYFLPDTPPGTPAPRPRTRPTSEVIPPPPSEEEEAERARKERAEPDPNEEFLRDVPDPLELPDPIEIPEENDTE